MPKMVRLIAPAGTDECNFGTTRYLVHEDGTLIVPAEVAADLTHGAGFALALDQPADDVASADVPPPVVGLGDPIE
jgi:hypothetical protein